VLTEECEEEDVASMQWYSSEASAASAVKAAAGGVSELGVWVDDVVTDDTTVRAAGAFRFLHCVHHCFDMYR
jgi:hypothetical protein